MPRAQPTMATPAALCARPFGEQAADLEIDFGDPDRPALVTAILAACSAPGEATDWWHRPVGSRTAALLGLAGTRTLRPVSVCPACDEPIEAELPVTELLALEPAEAWVALDETHRLRRPTGHDLRRLRGGEIDDAGWLQGLALDGELAPADEAAALDVLAAADPLVGFEVQLCCALCGGASTVELDLEALALARLADQQRRLLREVHALAGAYGWSEAQILGVPASRRARYLELIEATA